MARLSVGTSASVCLSAWPNGAIKPLYAPAKCARGLPTCLMSYTDMECPAVPAANTFASQGLAATQHTFVPMSIDNVLAGWLTSHSFSVQSSDALANTCGRFGENASDHTRCWCPSNDCMLVPASQSHSMMVLCGAPQDRSLPASAGLNARLLIRHGASSLRAGAWTLQMPVTVACQVHKEATASHCKIEEKARSGHNDIMW
jgi:hypothetical protein